MPHPRKTGLRKRHVVEALRDRMRGLFEALKRASDTARVDATDEESRARSKYDTQGLEASYLAAGQAERAEDIAAMMTTLNASPFPPFTRKDPIGEGALVELDFGGDREWFLLAPCAGGTTVEVGGVEVTVLAPGAPLRRKLQGLRVRERLQEPEARIESIG